MHVVEFAYDVRNDYEFKQGVALTGRNCTGPPCSVTVEL